MALGDALWPATQYGNRYVVEDPRSIALLRLGLAAYHRALAPCIQLEEALYFLRALNAEYPYKVTVRPYMEHVGRCHKATKIGQTWASDLDAHEDEHRQCAIVRGDAGTHDQRPSTTV